MLPDIVEGLLIVKTGLKQYKYSAGFRFFAAILYEILWIIRKRVLQLQYYITENDMEIIVKQNRETVKQKMSDILLDVSWAKISERYFEKSRSWLYHKMDGMNNGKPDDFNEAEKETLRNALFDLSKRIHKCAESI